jgi:hypothetical protein
MVHQRFVQDNANVIRRVRRIKEDLDILFQLSGEYKQDQVSSVESDIEDDSVSTREIVENLQMMAGTMDQISTIGTFLRAEGREMEQGAIDTKIRIGKLLDQSKRWK